MLRDQRTGERHLSSRVGTACTDSEGTAGKVQQISVSLLLFQRGDDSMSVANMLHCAA